MSDLNGSVTQEDRNTLKRYMDERGVSLNEIASALNLKYNDTKLALLHFFSKSHSFCARGQSISEVYGLAPNVERVLGFTRNGKSSSKIQCGYCKKRLL